MAEENNTETTQDSKLVGLLAQFDDPGSLVSACDQARQAGYTKTDAYSPFPVHGIDDAIGIKRSRLPFIVLGVALNAVVVGLGMQWYTNSNSWTWSPLFPGYGFMIGGKPEFSLPANIPVTFEVIVLSSAFATFFGMWFLNRLPRFSNPLFQISRFKRVTNDKFFLMIEEGDEKFDRSSTESQLNQWGAVAIEECRQDLTDSALPSWLRMAAILGAVLLMLPPAAIFKQMGMTNRAPRLHFMPDMDWQIKVKAQNTSPDWADGNPIFADDRGMRAPVAGSFARGQLQLDTEMYQGIRHDYVAPAAVEGEPVTEDLTKYVTTFPDEIVVDQTLLARGQERFNIYCSACHGYAGNGDGLVNQRALALNMSQEAKWTAAKSLHDPIVKDASKNPLGRIFETITDGRTMMGPYRDQIPAEDRWAIVAYVKALQATGIKPAGADEEAKESDDAATPAP